MSQIRGFVKFKYTPTGGTEIVFTGRMGDVAPDHQTIPITDIDETNHQLVEVGEEIIQSKFVYNITDIHSVSKGLFDILYGSNAGSEGGLTLSAGTGIFEMHDHKDAANTPLHVTNAFTCKVRVEKIEIGIEEVKAASMTVTTIGTTRPKYKVRGEGATLT